MIYRGNDLSRRILFRIAKEELVENVKEVLSIKTLDSRQKVYMISVKVEDEKTYIVHAVVKLLWGEEYLWKLIDLSWEEEK